MTPVSVINLVDALAFGGTERMAINIVNHLPQERYRAILCTTRAEGALASLVAPHVGRLRIHRSKFSDNLPAIRDLVRFIRRNDVRILHAHSSTLFIARAAAAIAGRVAVIWHAHWGKTAVRDDSALAYRAACLGVGAAVAANEQLRQWIAARFPIAPERVYYLPNIATPLAAEQAGSVQLPGVPGKRIVCVANLRPEKDHPTLIRAMAILCEHHPDAHLILVGVPLIRDSAEQMKAAVEALGLNHHVTYLGPRSDVSEIMRACNIGVLSSTTEGLPVSLLEYGMAGLAVVTTPAGQSEEVVDGGRAGLLVPSGSPAELAGALGRLLSDKMLQRTLSETFHRRVNAIYGPDAVISQLSSIYDSVLQTDSP